MNRDMNACINIRKISSDWINHKSRNNNFSRNNCIDSNKGENNADQLFLHELNLMPFINKTLKLNKIYFNIGILNVQRCKIRCNSIQSGNLFLKNTQFF